MIELPSLETQERDLLEARFWSKVKKGKAHECWEWQARLKWNGYGDFYFKDYKNQRAHRLAYALHTNCSLASSQWVLHKCDNRKCCNPYHLYLGDRSANMRDALNRGRWVSPATGNTWSRGEGNGQSLLTEVAVRQIKVLIGEGLTNRAIASMFGVSATTISLIRSGKRWTHVTTPS